MKSAALLSLLLLFTCFAAQAQPASYYLEIQEGSKPLTIRIDREAVGEDLHYTKAIVVQDKNETDRSGSVRRIFHAVPFAEFEATTISFEPHKVTGVKSEAVPFTTLIEEDPLAGWLIVSYQDVVDGNAHSYERTFNKQMRTGVNIQKLIAESAKQSGFPMNNSCS